MPKSSPVGDRIDASIQKRGFEICTCGHEGVSNGSMVPATVLDGIQTFVHVECVR